MASDPKKDMELILRTKAEGDGAEKTVAGLDKVTDQTEKATAATEALDAAQKKQQATEKAAALSSANQPGGDQAAAITKQNEASKESLEITREVTEAIKEQTEEVLRLGDTGETVAERQAREAEQQKQRLKDASDVRVERQARELAAAKEADQAQIASLALRGASILAVTKLASEAAQQVQEVTKEAEKLGVTLPESVKAAGLAIEAIMNPAKFVIDTISANTRKVLDDLKAAQDLVKETKDFLKLLQDEKRRTDSAFATNAVTESYERQLRALRSLNDEREREKRIAGNRLENERSREDAATQQQLNNVRRTKDGAAETVGVAQIEVDTAKRELARQQQDQAKQIADAEAKVAEIGKQLDAAVSQSIGLQNQLESAREAERKAAENRLTNPEAFDAAKTTREEKESARDSARSTEERLAEQLEEAQGFVAELKAKAEDNHKRMLQEFGDAMSDVSQSTSDVMTQAAKEQIDAVDKVRQKIEEEGGKVSERTESLVAELTKLISDGIPDASQIAAIQNVMIQLRTTTEAKDAAFLAVTNANIQISQQTLVLVEQLKGTVAQLQAQIERINRR